MTKLPPLALSLMAVILAVISANSKRETLLNLVVSGFKNELKEVFCDIKIPNYLLMWKNIG